MPREKSVVQYWDAVKPVAGDAEETLDLLMSLDRTPKGVNCTSTILPGSRLYLRKAQRFLKWHELMDIQGLDSEQWPRVSEFTAHHINDITGNSWTLVIVIAYLVGIHLHIPWNSPAAANPTSHAESSTTFGSVLQHENDVHTLSVALDGLASLD